MVKGLEFIKSKRALLLVGSGLVATSGVAALVLVKLRTMPTAASKISNVKIVIRVERSWDRNTLSRIAFLRRLQLNFCFGKFALAQGKILSVAHHAPR